MTSRKRTRARAAALAGAAALLGARSASAEELPPDNGYTAIGEICMQRVFGAPVNKSNMLNCTANDIRLSEAIDWYPKSCIRGSTFDLTATFTTVVTANARYDAAFYFRIDGEGTARGDGKDAAGTCSLSALTFPPSPALNLDADLCGDLNAGTYDLTFTIPDVVCAAAPGTDELRLPNCTSWHSNQGTACEASALHSVALADMDAAATLDFDPDTKSKCVCDDNFTVPVVVEAAKIAVVKTATPDQVPESGGWVTYTIVIDNASEMEPVYVDSVIDNVYGDLGANEVVDGVVDNECVMLIGTEIAPGDSATCTFKVYEAGNAGSKVEDTVDACVTQKDVPEGTEPTCGSDDAVVTFTDKFTPPSLDKRIVARSCLVDVEYEVAVKNHSDLDTLTVNALSDDKFGDITATHGAGNGFEAVTETNCAPPAQGIAPLGEFRCRFKGQIASGTCSLTHTNEATADVTDDDGVNSTPSDTATVTVTSAALDD